MKILLDTHAFLWYFDDSDKLSKKAADIIENRGVQKYVSIACYWEFTIKYGIGRLKFDGGPPQLWNMILQNGFTILPITQPYIEKTIHLPLIHRDPFDRLLVATAITDGLTILTADENIHKYDAISTW